jgi:ubiquinone biosynthesis monooxygenase Coq7
MTEDTRTRLGRLPGDLSHGEMVDRVLRVDHAGEYGAVRIYAGQLAVLGRSASAETLEHMARQERQHLDRFEQLMKDRRVRPTALQPLWHLAGFALGAGTALLGERAAMACTVAVEQVIDEHYKQQAEVLGSSTEAQEPELVNTIQRFRQEEIEHRDMALAQGAEATPGYEVLSAAIKVGSRLAIWLSERI